MGIDISARLVVAIPVSGPLLFTNKEGNPCCEKCGHIGKKDKFCEECGGRIKCNHQEVINDKVYKWMIEHAKEDAEGWDIVEYTDCFRDLYYHDINEVTDNNRNAIGVIIGRTGSHRSPSTRPYDIHREEILEAISFVSNMATAIGLYNVNPKVYLSMEIG
jgi:hypothetical protein